MALDARLLIGLLACSFVVLCGGSARGDLTIGFIAYNGTVSGSGTGVNTTTYSANGTDSGMLKDVGTGDYTVVSLVVSATGVTYQNSSGSPAAGTDAHDIFDGYVHFGSGNGNSLEVSGNDTYSYAFSGLDPGGRYEFAGTACRGKNDYDDRWTLVTLVGAESFTAAHSTGSGIVTEGLGANEAALWTGANHNDDQGFVVQWKDIDPGADGIFEIVSTQYKGATPGVGSGTADGSKGYALTGIRVIEVVPEPSTVLLLGIGSVALLTKRRGHS